MKHLLSLPALASFLALLPVRADRVDFVEGGSIEGRVEEPAPGSGVVRVRLQAGWVEIRRDRVAKITPGQTPWEAYAAKSAALAPADAKGHVDLALWCRRAGLTDESRQEFEKALAADAECTEARQALGWRKVNGAWTQEPEKPAPGMEGEVKEAVQEVTAGKEGKEEKKEPEKTDQAKPVPRGDRRPVEGLFGPLGREGEAPAPRPRREAPPAPLDYGAWWALYGPPRPVRVGTAWPWPVCPEVPCPPAPSCGLGLSGQLSLDGGRLRIRLN